MSYQSSVEAIAESIRLPELRNEEGGVKVGAAIIAGLGCAAALAAGPFGHFMGLRLTQKVDTEKSMVNAKHILTDSIAMSCKTHDFYDATGSLIRLNMMVSKYEIPEANTNFTFEKGSIVAVTSCQDESKGSAIKSSENGVIETEDGTEIAVRVVEINTDNIVTTAKFPEGNQRITRTEGALMSAAIASSQGGKLALTAACLPFKAGAKIGGKSLDCGKFASVATKAVNKIQTKGQTTAEETVLKTIQQRGSEEAWQQQTLPAFIDSLACTAVEDGGADALQALRIKITGKNPTPDFSKDMFDKYQGSVLASNDSEVKTIPKVKVNVGKPYVPKCYKQTITDPNTGLTSLSN